MVALLVLFTILTFLTVDYFVQRSRREATATEAMPHARVSPIGALTPPPDAFLAPGHAWLRLEPAGTVRIGSDRLAPALLGGISHADIRPRGARVRRGERFATLEHDGREVALRSPVDGIVSAVNADVLREPSRTAADPFGDGWLVRVEPMALGAALHGMVIAREAAAWMRNELRRLRDALVEGAPQLAPTLPDGGLPVDGVARRLDAVAWERIADRMFGAETLEESPR